MVSRSVHGDVIACRTAMIYGPLPAPQGVANLWHLRKRMGVRLCSA